MDVMHLRIFQTQVLLQCKFVLLASDTVNTAVTDGDAIGTFSALQALLNAAANISKAFWGSGAQLIDERLALRQSVGVMDDSPLKLVAVRNHFEHIDERIDRWWKDSEAHNHVDLFIGPHATISGIKDSDRFRAYDPNTADVVFWGDEFNVRDLVSAIEQLLPKLQVEASKPHWEVDD